MPVVLANGTFRSGSTFFFDAMRQSDQNVCFYEPFHPRMNQLIQAEHQASLGHSLSSSPWLEHVHCGGMEEYYNYAAHLPLYIVERMGYHSPLHLTDAALGYFQSLPLLANRLHKNIFACFNRAAFVLGEAIRLVPDLSPVIAYTRRPSIQIAISFLRLYATGRSFNLYSREFRDPWGLTLMFQHHYTQYSDLYLHRSLPPTLFSFLAKICYINTEVDRQMMPLSDFVFDISGSVDAYVQACLGLLQKLDRGAAADAVVAYVRNAYRQDPFPARIRPAFLGAYDRQLLDSIGFAEFQ